MPASKQEKVLVACPHCGHSQPEPRAAFSTICKKCGCNYQVKEARSPAPKAVEVAFERKRITCFECGREAGRARQRAQSSMCKWCSRYIDLQDYRIANAVPGISKPRARSLLNRKAMFSTPKPSPATPSSRDDFTESWLRSGSLTIYSTAEIKGSFTAGHLIIPAENHFRWKEPINAGSAEIAGELAANLHAKARSL